MYATAGTFAFKRKLLEQTRYDDDAELAEEKKFLKNYSIPLVQLDPKKSILVFAHQDNTFDKRRLLPGHPNYVWKPICQKMLIKDTKEMNILYECLKYNIK